MEALKILDLRGVRSSRALERLLDRAPFDEEVEATAARILKTIRRGGDRALRAAVRRYDGADLRGPPAVPPAERREAASRVPPPLRAAMRRAYRNIRAFAREERPRSWMGRRDEGVRLGERFVPYERVGIYVPGGTAPLVSTVLMTATFARVAGVREIVAATPPRPDGTVDPAILFALSLTGCTEVFRMGGAHAIGALAFGTETIRPVQMIAGPGGPYVTSAKRQVYGYVAVDLVAGPSEILVLADGSADPGYVAADILSQAEHGSGRERCLLVTTSVRLARAAAREIERRLPRLTRREAVERVLASGAHAVVVDDMERAIEIANRFAPEHLEVMTRDPRRIEPRLTAAGAVFVGPSTPEPIGDYMAGPSHVLPTGGAAHRFSGLSTRSFMRRISRIEYSDRALARDAAATIEIALAEGLDAHAESVRARIGRKKKKR